MDKCILIIYMFALFLAAQGMMEEIDMLAGFESFEIEDDDWEEELNSDPGFLASQKGGKVLVNVDSFGAVGDGIADDTEVNT